MYKEWCDELGIDWYIMTGFPYPTPEDFMWYNFDRDKDKILFWYVADRMAKRRPIWYPCTKGYARFGHEADAFKGGHHFNYKNVPAVFIDKLPLGDTSYIMKVAPIPWDFDVKQNAIDLLTLLILWKIT